MKAFLSILLLLQFHLIQGVFPQTNPFEKEVRSLVEKYKNSDWQKGGIVFTGSSSIRMWNTLEKDFPKVSIINTGFGGSQTHDLIFYLDELVIDFSPSKVFIYEGDNDVYGGKPSRQIIEEHIKIITKIKEKLPDAKLYFISAKPSPSRWTLKEKYEDLNDNMRQFCLNQPDLTFVDIWTPMLDKQGKPEQKLFLEDDLHMNQKGYKIWKKTIKSHLK